MPIIFAYLSYQMTNKYIRVTFNSLYVEVKFLFVCSPIANFLWYFNSIFRNILSYFIISLTVFFSVDVIVDSLSISVPLFYFFFKRSFWALQIYPWKIANGFLCRFTILTFPIIIPIKYIKTTFVWNWITWMIIALFKNNL